MDKERLEHIKKYVEDITGMLVGEGKSPNDSFLKDMIWLICTVEEQQKEIEKLKEISKELNEDLFYERMEKDNFRRLITENLKPNNVLLEKDNARLRQEMKFYAVSKTWNQEHIKENEYKVPIALNDEGEKARQALAK